MWIFRITIISWCKIQIPEIKYSNMNVLFELMKILLPAALVFVAVYFVLQQMLERERQVDMIELRKGSQKIITPLKIQAYERIVLFLERISPNSLVMRVHKTGMSGRLLQADLLKSIREEYEHNLSQQIYLSDKTWDVICQAKEEIVQLLTVAGSKVPADATGMDLSKMIFQICQELGSLPTDKAVMQVKGEFRKVI